MDTRVSQDRDHLNELLMDGQEEVFSRTEVELGRIEHQATAGGRAQTGHSSFTRADHRRAEHALDAAYEDIAAANARLGSARGYVRRLALDGLCREATRVSQIGEDVLQPRAVGHVPTALIDAAVIQWDLVRVLVLEILETDAHSWLQTGLIAALLDGISRRRDAELGASGLVGLMVAAGCAPDRLADAIQERAQVLDQQYRCEGWYALQPQALETLRSSIGLPSAIARRCDVLPE